MGGQGVRLLLITDLRGGQAFSLAESARYSSYYSSLQKPCKCANCANRKSRSTDRNHGGHMYCVPLFWEQSHRGEKEVMHIVPFPLSHNAGNGG